MDTELLSQDICALSAWLHDNIKTPEAVGVQNDENYSLSKLLQQHYPNIHKLYAFKYIQEQLQQRLAEKVSSLAHEAFACGPERVQDYVQKAIQLVLKSEELQTLQHRVRKDLESKVQQLRIVEADDAEFLRHLDAEDGSQGDSEVEILKLDPEDDDGDGDGGSFGGNSWGGCGFGEQRAEECINKLEVPHLQGAALLDLKAAHVDDLCNLACWDKLCGTLKTCLQTTQDAHVKQDAAQMVVSLLTSTNVDSPVQSAQLLCVLLDCVLPTLKFELDASGASSQSFAGLKQQLQHHAMFKTVDVSLSALLNVANSWHLLSNQLQDELSEALCSLVHQSIAQPDNAATCVTDNVICVNVMAAWLLLDPSAEWWHQMWATAPVSVCLSKCLKGSVVLRGIKHDKHTKPLSLPHQRFSTGKGTSSRPQSGIRSRSGFRPPHAQPLPVHHTLQQAGSPAHSRPTSAARPRSGFRSQHHMPPGNVDGRQGGQHHPSHAGNLHNLPSGNADARQGSHYHPPNPGNQHSQGFQGYKQALQRLPSVNRNYSGQQAGGWQHQLPPDVMRHDVLRPRQHSGHSRIVCTEVYRGVLAVAVLPLMTSAAARQRYIMERSVADGGGGGSEEEDRFTGLEMMLGWSVRSAMVGTSSWWAPHICTEALMEAVQQEVEVFTPMSVSLLLQPLQSVAAGKSSSFEDLDHMLHLCQTVASMIRHISCTVYGRSVLTQPATRAGLAHGETPLTAIITAVQGLLGSDKGGHHHNHAHGRTTDIDSVIAAYVDIISAVQSYVPYQQCAGITRIAELLAKAARQRGSMQGQQDSKLVAALVQLCAHPLTVATATAVPDTARLCSRYLTNMYLTGRLEHKERVILLASHFALTVGGCHALVKAGFLQAVLASLGEVFLQTGGGAHLLQCTASSHPQLKLLQHGQQVFAWRHLIKCLKQEAAGDQPTVIQWLRQWLSCKPDAQSAYTPSPEAVHICLTVLRPVFTRPAALQKLNELLDLSKLLQGWLQPVTEAAILRSSLAYLSSSGMEQYTQDMNTGAILELLQMLSIPCCDIISTNETDDEQPNLLQAVGSIDRNLQLLLLREEPNLSGTATPRSPLEAAVCAAPGMRDGGAWLEELSHALGGELASGTELPRPVLAIMLQRTAMVALRGAHRSNRASSRWDHSHTPAWQPLKVVDARAGSRGGISQPDSDAVLAAELIHWLHHHGQRGPERDSRQADTGANSVAASCRADRQAVLSLSRLVHGCWSTKGAAEHHPDFFLALTWEIMGATQTSAEFLSQLTRSRAAQYWWPQWGKAVAGCTPILRCCSCVYFVVQHEDPAIANVLQQTGVCLGQVVGSWLQHNFVHLLPCEEAVKVLCAAVVLGPDYLIYATVALLQHFRHKWTAFQASNELAASVWAQAADGFSLCQWFHYMQDLHHKYRHVVLDMLEL